MSKKNMIEFKVIGVDRLITFVKVLSFAFLIYAFARFLQEIIFQELALIAIWATLSPQQRALENINLGLMDLKLMFSVLCLIFFAKFWGLKEK